MLVLARQRDETVVIGDNIEVTVVDIRGDKVRLGINAPKNVSVHRKEVYDAIRKENRDSGQICTRATCRASGKPNAARPSRVQAKLSAPGTTARRRA